MKRRTAIALLMMCSLGAWAEPWTLRDCIQHALQNNITIRKNRVSEESGEATLKQNKSVLWPSLSFSNFFATPYNQKHSCRSKSSIFFVYSIIIMYLCKDKYI
jgi:outer membrane protein TolC